uniref:Uncharacterized protein n=1 Tax=Arundo donax TaxID=35708 RepID=A0A0A8YYE2_ARUDO
MTHRCYQCSDTPKIRYSLGVWLAFSWKYLSCMKVQCYEWAGDIPHYLQHFLVLNTPLLTRNLWFSSPNHTTNSIYG